MSNIDFNELGNLEDLISKNDFSINNETIKESFNSFFLILKKQNNQIQILENSVRKNKKKLKEYKTNFKKFNIDDVNLLKLSLIVSLFIEKSFLEINSSKFPNTLKSIFDILNKKNKKNKK
jgi:hypothetical protein